MKKPPEFANPPAIAIDNPDTKIMVLLGFGAEIPRVRPKMVITPPSFQRQPHRCCSYSQSVIAAVLQMWRWCEVSI
ncbi:MAG: hypothetical protein DRO89_03780 [Candidatus Altiarchaeales archaeon]|nr:MAG: hypothetical protein DRO89_03780 [Candidatus Altiarchaeales archaeon]